MDKIKVDKHQLLETLKENRKNHVNTYDEVLESYRAKGVELLAEHIERIRNGAVEKIVVTLPQPKNYEEEYDRAIAMLEWSEDEYIELYEHEFDSYVMDKWDWKREFNTTAASYSGG